MRHGLTMGELTHWFICVLDLEVDCRVIPMQGWEPDVGTRLRLAARGTHLDQSEP